MAQGAVIPLRAGREAPRGHKQTMETMLLSRSDVEKWDLPPFQRPLKLNAKVQALSEDILKGGGIIPGVVTLGQISGDRGRNWLVDGQHRRASFLLTELGECIVDVRIQHFDTMADMAEAFVELNSRLVNMRPDDILRGLEGTLPLLAKIRGRAHWIGYGDIRRYDKSPILSMSTMLRAWNGSKHETPGGGGNAGKGAVHIARELEEADVDHLIKFLTLAYQAWGSDAAYHRLWNSLNLTVCMWLFRTLVLSSDRGVKRYVRLTADQFKRCLMQVSTQSDYLDWLTGRQMTDRDRAPGYTRLKSIFVGRLREDEPGMRVLMPQPAWG